MASPAPEWAHPSDFALNPIPIDPSQNSVQCLLRERQQHKEEHTLYAHFAFKVLSSSGVHQLSQLNFDYDPTFQKVDVHSLRIYRDGQWLDRLETSRRNTIQREENLDQNQYNGNLSLVYFIDDLREGDILDYSFSTIGESPVFASHLYTIINLQHEQAIEKTIYKILAPPTTPLSFKNFNTSLEPTITDISPSLREWTWQTTSSSPYSFEPSLPDWYFPLAHTEVSEYKNWQELAQKIAPLYTLPLATSPEMTALTEKWQSITPHPSERALLALRFVQDEVRYLGFEEGVGAFKPTDPSITLQRRFGDCKDKTFLLHAFLQQMGIESTPLLVHSRHGKILPDSLPIPSLFDHIILQIKIGNSTYTVDPTINLQGGSLEDTTCPLYHFGLLLRPNTTDLTPIPEHSRKPDEIDTSITLISEDAAHLTIRQTYHTSRADIFRDLLNWKGVKKLSDDNLREIQEIYGGGSALSPLAITDDREKNTLTIIQSYTIPTRHSAEKKVLDTFSMTLRDYLFSGVNPARSSPLALAYPLWVKEHIHIENPYYNYPTSSQHSRCDNDSFSYHYSDNSKGHTTDYHYELKNLSDHIAPADLRYHWEQTHDISRHMFVEQIIATPQPSTSQLWCTFFFLVWIALVLFSRHSPSTLELHLQRAWRFYSIFMFVFLYNFTPNTTVYTISIITLLICGKHFQQRIFNRKSSQDIMLALLVIALHIGLVAYLIYPFSSWEQAAPLILTLLYLGTAMRHLLLARKFLSQDIEILSS